MFRWNRCMPARYTNSTYVWDGIHQSGSDIVFISVYFNRAMALDHAPSVHTLVSLLEVRSTVEDAVRAEASAFSYDEELVPKSAAEKMGGGSEAPADSASRLMAGLGIAGAAGRCPLK